MGYLVLQGLGGQVPKHVLLAAMLLVLLVLAWLLHVLVKRPLSKKLGAKVAQLVGTGRAQ
jgi:peptidoglycan/LPS O-acetylase OafA/YrhL